MIDPEAKRAWLDDARARMKPPTAHQLEIVRAAFSRAQSAETERSAAA